MSLRSSGLRLLKTLSMSDKTAELKTLRVATRSQMVMPPGFDQFEVRSKRPGKRLRVVAHNRQPATSFGTVGSEGRDDHMTAGPHRLLKAQDICSAVCRLGQEVKGGAIVPEVVAVRRLPGGDISGDPIDPVSAPPEPLFRLLEGLCGKIEYRYLVEALVEDAINQP